ASITADSVTVAYNTSTNNYSTTVLNVGGLTADLKVGAGAVGAPLAVVTVIKLQGDIAGFVHVSGNFGFKSDVSGAQVVATNVAAHFGAGSVSVDLSGGTLALEQCGWH